MDTKEIVPTTTHKIRTSVYKTCGFCGKTILVSQCRIRRSNKFYCTVDCSHRGQSSIGDYNIKHICINCNNAIINKPSYFAKLKGEPTCSRKCRGEYLQKNYRGNKNPNCKYKTPLESFFARKLSNTKCAAKKRNLDFNLDLQYLLDLYKNQDGKCFYSGVKLRLVSENINSRPNVDCLSLDRIDSNLGYIKNNIVFCCYGVNIMKSDYNFNKFTDIIVGLFNKNAKPSQHKQVEVFRLNEKAIIPTRNYNSDAGLDLYAIEDIFVPLGKTSTIKTGIAIRVPENFVGLLRERSSIGKAGLTVAAGVIDASFSGDLSIMLMNISANTCYDAGSQSFGYTVKAGERIAQLILTPIVTPTPVLVDNLWESARGNRGFGSSGA